MINCNENENNNEKQIIWLVHLDEAMDTSIQNIAYLGEIMSVCNKQHLSNIWSSLSSTEAELKKSVAHKKMRVSEVWSEDVTSTLINVP